MGKNIFYKKKKYGILCIAPFKGLIYRTFKAIEYIKKVDKNSFYLIKNNLQNIFIVEGQGYFNTYFIDDNIWFTVSGGIKDNHLIYLASLLVHESQHMVQSRKNKKYFGALAEKDAYLAQRNFLEKIPNKELKKWFIDWLDNQFSKKWWVTFDKKSNINNDFFINILKDYKKGRLKIKSF